MPHYKNGREAKVGDPVIGTVFNTKGTIAGTLLSVTPGEDCCSCLVGFMQTKYEFDPGVISMAKRDVPVREHGSEQHGSSGAKMKTHWCEDYSECKHLHHAGDALIDANLMATPPSAPQPCCQA
jgi:hypothetical protein